MGGYVIYGSDGVVLEAAYTGSLEQCREEVIADIRATAAARIEAIWPLWRQINTLRGTPEEIAAMGAEIDAIRAESNVAQAKAESATTHEELLGPLPGAGSGG